MKLFLLNKKHILFSIIFLTFYSFNSLIYANNLNDLKSNQSRVELYKNIGGSGDDYILSAEQTSDGFIIVGYSNSSDNGFQNNGENDAFISKYDNNGLQEWFKIFGGSRDDYFRAVKKTSDNGFVAVGSSSSDDVGFSNKGSEDAIIVKYDENGNQEWVKNFGGEYTDIFYDVIETTSNDFICVGDSKSDKAGFPSNGSYDAVIVKFNENGNQEWVKNFGGSSHVAVISFDRFNAIVETNDNGFLAAGDSPCDDAGFQNNGDNDAIIVKYDEDGNQEWVKNFGGTRAETFTDIIRVSDGFIAVGYSASSDAGFKNFGEGGRYDDMYDAIIVKYDFDGNQEWVKNFGGTVNDYFSNINITSDGGFITSGYSDSLDAGFVGSDNEYRCYDAITIKYNSDFEIEFVKSFNGKKDDRAILSFINPNNEIFVFGYSSSTESIFENKGKTDGIIMKIKDISPAEIATENAELTNTVEDIETARDLVNKLPESEEKEELQDRLNKIDPNLEFEVKNATANLDIYIKSKNMLSLSVNTNNITFEDFSGVDDIEKLNALTLTINSSLPYDLRAYLPNEIRGSRFNEIMDKRIFNIRASGKEYQTFNDTVTPIILLDNEVKGNKKVHNIDFKLKGNLTHKKDIYKATVKFEVVQK